VASLSWTPGEAVPGLDNAEARRSRRRAARWVGVDVIEQKALEKG
jgi:hypothetical protein